MEAFSVFLLIFSCLASVLAQQTYTINPNSVPLSTREQWCTSQKTQCPLICLQVGNRLLETRENDCSADTLTYTCVCQNGISPNVSQYSLTLPYFVCTEWGTQCVANCGSDSACASDCRQNHPCGAQDPSPPNKTIIAASKSAAAAASASKTKGPGAVYTGFADGSGEGAAGMLLPPTLFAMGENGGLMAVSSAMFLAFAFVL